MDVNNEKAKAHQQLSYDALLIHGLAVVAAVGTAIIAVSFMPGEAKDAAAVLGVGLAATLVLGIWSLVLAVRALRKKEPSHWPLVVIGLVIFEVLLYGIAWPVWRWGHAPKPYSIVPIMPRPTTTPSAGRNTPPTRSHTRGGRTQVSEFVPFFPVLPCWKSLEGEEGPWRGARRSEKPA